MAEAAAGLTIGAIALASLYSTCIELFDCFELARHYADDYQMACTKMCLLKARLASWGIALNLRAPGHEHPALRQHWAEEQDVVARGLFGIQDVFENAAVLAEKHKPTSQRSPTVRTIASHASAEPDPGARESRSSRVSVAAWASFRKRTVWAIHDRQKFDNFIQTLSFLIENLEKITTRIEMSSTAQELAGVEPARLPMPGPARRPVAQIQASGHVDTNTCSQQRPGHRERASQHRPSKNKALNVPHLASQMSGHVFTGHQNVLDAVGVMGSVGKSDQRHIFTGGQTVTRGGFGIMGNASATAAVDLQKGTQEWDPDDEVDETEDEYDGGDSQHATPADASDPVR